MLLFLLTLLVIPCLSVFNSQAMEPGDNRELMAGPPSPKTYTIPKFFDEESTEPHMDYAVSPRELNSEDKAQEEKTFIKGENPAPSPSSPSQQTPSLTWWQHLKNWWEDPLGLGDVLGKVDWRGAF